MMCLTSTITSSLMSLGVDRLCRTSNVSPSESGVLCTCANIYLNWQSLRMVRIPSRHAGQLQAKMRSSITAIRAHSSKVGETKRKRVLRRGRTFRVQNFFN